MVTCLVSVYRQKDGGANPASFNSPKGAKLAGWRGSYDWYHWLRVPVREGKAIDLGGNGYPDRYTAIASEVLAHHLVDKWAKDRGAVAECRPNEWLIIDSWDES